MAPSIKTSSLARVRLDTDLPPPLNHPPLRPVPQPRRAAPGENNCPPKPVGWALPPTLPLDWRHELLVCDTCRPSRREPRGMPPPTASNRHSNFPEQCGEWIMGKMLFFISHTYEPYHSPGCQGRHPHAHMHRASPDRPTRCYGRRSPSALVPGEQSSCGGRRPTKGWLTHAHSYERPQVLLSSLPSPTGRSGVSARLGKTRSTARAQRQRLATVATPRPLPC